MTELDGFDEFVQQHSLQLVPVAYFLCGDTESAEDLVQQSLFRVARKWGAAQASPLAYTRRVLVNLSHDRWRRKSRRPRRDRRAETPDLPDLRSTTAPDRMIERRLILDILRGLPRRQREVIVVRFYLDLSVAESAQTLGISDGAVKAYTSRALEPMRVALAGADTDEEMAGEVKRGY